MTSGGRVTIPKAMRDHLGLNARDRVRIFVRRAGGVVLLPVLPVSALRGIVPPRASPVTVEEMTEAAAAGAVESRLRLGRKG